MTKNMGKTNNSHNWKDNVKSYLIFLWIIPFLLILLFVPEIVYKLQKLIFVGDKAHVIIPYWVAYNMQGFYFLLFVISVFTLPITFRKILTLNKLSHDIKNYPRNNLFVVSFFILIQLCAVFFVIHQFFSFITISDNKKLIDKNGLFRDKIYYYDNVVEVRLSYFSGIYLNGIFYELVFTNNKKVNLTSRGPNIYLLKFVEKNIPQSIPHKTTSEAHKKLLKYVESRQDSLLFRILFRNSFDQ